MRITSDPLLRIGLGLRFDFAMLPGHLKQCPDQFIKRLSGECAFVCVLAFWFLLLCSPLWLRHTGIPFWLDSCIQQPLSGSLPQGDSGALGIANLAVVVPEIKLTDIAAQVPLADMLIYSRQAAFKNGEISLDSVGVNPTAITDVDSVTMFDNAMR